MATPVILIEAAPFRAADGVAETVRLAGGGGEYPFFYGGEHWRAGIAGLPTFITSLDFEGGELGTGGIPSVAALEWGASGNAGLSGLAGYFWPGAAVTVRIGDENAAGTLPPVALVGRVLDATTADGRLKLAMADPAAELKKPLPASRFAGTGGLEGPAEWDGQLRPRVFGRVWNLQGEAIDKANNIYCFADPTRPIQAFVTLRDRGAPAAAMSVLPWQGSAPATFAALQAAEAPEGGGVACPSIACVKWWTTPGMLTVDLQGEIGAGYVETTAEIAQRLVDQMDGPAFAAGAVAAAAALRPAPVGWVVNDDTTAVTDMLDELFGNVSLLWVLDAAGEIAVREWTWGVSVATARSLSVSRKKMIRPLGTRKLGYQRNETPTERSALAAILLGTDVTYQDGTPIEALKPAEPGATAGATPDQVDQLANLALDAAAAAVAIAAAEQTIVDMQADAVALQASLTQAQADILANGENIETMETTLGEHDASISILQTTADNQAGELATLTSTVNTQGASITANATAITTLQGSVATLDSTVSAQGSSITSLQAASSTQAGQIATLQTTVSAQGANITSLQATTSTIQGNVAALTTKVSAGNANLVPNGGFENGLVGWSGSGWNWTYNGWGAQAFTSSSGVSTLASSLFPVFAGKSYTASADWAFFASGGVCYVDMIYFDSAGNQLLDGPQSLCSPTQDFHTDGAGREAIKVTSLAPSNAVKACVRFVVQGGVDVIFAGVRQVKVEQAAFATAYSAEASISESFTALSTLNTQYASLSSTVSTQGVTISSQQTAITVAQGNITTLFGRASLQVQVGGIITGWETNNNGVTGDFIVHADHFGIKNSTGDVAGYPFQVIGGQTFIRNAIIQNAAIDTIKIAGNAVTIPIAAYTAGDITLANGNFTVVQSIVINSSGAPIQISACVSLFVSGTLAGPLVWPILLRRDGVDIYTAVPIGWRGIECTSGFSFSDTPGPGAHTYQVLVYIDQNNAVSRKRFLGNLETMR